MRINILIFIFYVFQISNLEFMISQVSIIQLMTSKEWIFKSIFYEHMLQDVQHQF